jgi:flagellar motor switch protein FliG
VAMTDRGAQKGAILMLALGEEEAAEVMKHLGPREVQKLGQAMVAMSTVGADQVESVLDAFCSQADRDSSFSLSSDQSIRSILNKALGDDRAATLLGRILQKGDTSGIDKLKWMEAESVAELIRDEHPQIVATILVHLERDHACEILDHFSEHLRNDVILRIAALDGVQPAAMNELNDALVKLLTGSENLERMPVSGIRSAAEIINFMSGETEASAVASLRNYDEELAQKVVDEMFVFDNILEVDDRGIQLLLREVQSDALIVALKGASPALRDRIFKNMSQRAAEMMRDDLESKGPVRLSEVEMQQKQILQVVRRLADEGQIILGAKGRDAYV